MRFWAEKVKHNSKEFNPRRNARGAWILNLPRISPHSFSHALLPQRGAADLIEAPQRGEHRRPTFVLGAFIAAFVGGGSPSRRS